jgi:benzaldehyde dehydrogenase (NAD)
MPELLENLDWQGKVYSSGWRIARGGVVEAIEPATGEVLATTGLADAADVDAAVSAARQAQPDWAAQPGRSGRR